ncbi:MAG: CoA-binding protein [Proteobacteria bacterium]|nr:CoA-binding protein [Pseudomonadota bacterium]
MEARLKEALDAIFEPRSAAIIGASNNPRRWGFHTLRNMVEAGFRHPLYPINPGETEVQGFPCLASVMDVPGPVDLAVIVVNTTQVTDIIRDCVRKGVKGGIVITAGFAEISSEGDELQRRVAVEAREAGFYFIGPNCWGIWSSAGNVNTVFNRSMHLPKGAVAFLSQSGTLGEYLYNATAKAGFGVSKFVSLGNQASITFNDYLEYLGEDPSTRVITAYLEDVRDGRRFVELARRITPRKPVLVFKAGSTPASARAARSHTAALAGDDAIFDRACRQAGVIRWHDFMEMFDMADALCYQPLPRGNRVAVISPGGGFCVTAAEACTRLGLELPEMDPKAQSELRDQMVGYAPPPVNPIDCIARKSSEAYLDIVEIAARQDYIDGLIVTPRQPRFHRRVSPASMINQIRRAERLAAVPEKFGKPLILASEHELEGPVYEVFKGRHIPFFDNPFDCAKVMYGLAEYGRIVKGRR